MCYSKRTDCAQMQRAFCAQFSGLAIATQVKGVGVGQADLKDYELGHPCA